MCVSFIGPFFRFYEIAEGFIWRWKENSDTPKWTRRKCIKGTAHWVTIVVPCCPHFLYIVKSYIPRENRPWYGILEASSMLIASTMNLWKNSIMKLYQEIHLCLRARLFFIIIVIVLWYTFCVQESCYYRLAHPLNSVGIPILNWPFELLHFDCIAFTHYHVLDQMLRV